MDYPTERSPLYEFRLDDGLPPGYGNGRAGDITRFFRCEHVIDRRELARLRRSLHRDLFAEMRDGLDRHCRRNQRGPDRAWRDGVSPDAFLGQKLSEPAREVLNRSFCSGVSQKMGIGSVRVDRRRVDDRRAFGHVRHRGFYNVEHGGDVRGERFLPLFV